MSEKDVLALPTLTLAYVGDAAHSLFVRENLASGAHFKPDVLHQLASAEVKAAAQANLAESLLASFTETETAVYLRGRNAKAHHKAKNQSISDYRKATGLEAVLGYLYLTGQSERIVELLTRQ